MKLLKTLSLLTIICCTSCATILSDRITKHQRTKPAAGQPRRQIKPLILALDICFGPWAVAGDFYTGAIYKPLKKTTNDSTKIQR